MDCCTFKPSCVVNYATLLQAKFAFVSFKIVNVLKQQPTICTLVLPVVACLTPVLGNNPSAIAVAGRIIQFVLMSWVYAFYWFDYKWSLTNLPLERRVQFFQSHWVYFSGDYTPI